MPAVRLDLGARLCAVFHVKTSKRCEPNVLLFRLAASVVPRRKCSACLSTALVNNLAASNECLPCSIIHVTQLLSRAAYRSDHSIRTHGMSLTHCTALHSLTRRLLPRHPALHCLPPRHSASDRRATRHDQSCRTRPVRRESERTCPSRGKHATE